MNCNKRYGNRHKFNGHLRLCRTEGYINNEQMPNILDIINDVSNDISFISNARDTNNDVDDVWEDVESDQKYIQFINDLLKFKKELILERLQHLDIYLHCSSCNLSDKKCTYLLQTITRMFAREGKLFTASVKNWYNFRRKLELHFRELFQLHEFNYTTPLEICSRPRILFTGHIPDM